MASIQKAQKTASLLPGALTTSPTPLSSGEETVAVEVLFTLMSCTNDYICFFPAVSQSWERKGQAVFGDLSSSTRRQTAAFEKFTVAPR